MDFSGSGFRLARVSRWATGAVTLHNLNIALYGKELGCENFTPIQFIVRLPDDSFRVSFRHAVSKTTLGVRADAVLLSMGLLTVG